MAEPSIDVERVVREVLRELAAGQGGIGRGAMPQGGMGGSPALVSRATPGIDRTANESKGGQAAQGSPAAESEGRLVVSERIVTMAQLDGRLGGIRQVLVLPQAVVTPAVRDELDRRNVKLSFGPPAGVDVPAGALRLVLVATGTPFDPAPLVAFVQSQSILVVPHALDCLIASCDLLAHQVSQAKTLGLLLTRHTAAALCLANRLPSVRAVSAADADAASAAARAVGANVLVADPLAGSVYQLRQMVTVFCRGGVRECPEVFRKRLT